MQHSINVVEFEKIFTKVVLQNRFRYRLEGALQSWLQKATVAEFGLLILPPRGRETPRRVPIRDGFRG